METSFDVLEQKVRKAAELVRRLRKENEALVGDLGKARRQLHEAEKRLTALEEDKGAGGERAAELERLAHELDTLRREREEVRGRIARLVEALDGLD